MAAGDYASACAAFAESFRLDAKVGTLLDLADCEEHRGELAHAHAHWQQSINLAQAVGDDRIAFLNRRFASLDARVPKLVIARAPTAPRDSAITRDGIDLGQASLGQSIPLDPGHHEVVVTAPGFGARRYPLDLTEGMRSSIEVAPGNAALPPTAAPSPPPRVKPDGTGEPQAAPVSRWSTQKTLAVVSAGAGVVALGVGTVFGLTALSKKSDLNNEQHCASTGACDSSGAASAWNSLRDDANGAGTVSTVAFLLAGAGLAVAAVLWLTAPNGPGTPNAAAWQTVGAPGQFALGVNW
jgi:hypothetical protein